MPYVIIIGIGAIAYAITTMGNEPESTQQPFTQEQAHEKFLAVAKAIAALASMHEDIKIIAQETLKVVNTIEKEMLRGSDMEAGILSEPDPPIDLKTLIQRGKQDYIHSLRLAKDKYATTKNQRSAIDSIIRNIKKTQ